MKYIYSILILFLVSCNDRIKSDQKISLEDSINETLIGKWGGSSENNPTFEIRKDSIFYFEHSKAYSYKLSKQDMIINFPKLQMKWEKIHVINDTLFFFQDPGLSVRAVKFK